MLINYTYFDNGFVNIPNTDNAVTRARLTNLIMVREPLFLSQVLGNSLYAAFNTGIAGTDQKWKELRDGKQYEANGRQVKWRGLVEAASKESVIAYYVWYWWSRENSTTSTAVGETTEKKTNAKPASPAEKQAIVWNLMRDWCCDLYDFLRFNRSVYPEWSGETDCEFVTPLNPMF